MTSSDEHLEQSLDEYNRKVGELENNDDKEALVDALAYRSTILMLLESYVSSITDVDDALEICKELESEGKEIDPGIKIKLYENRGQLCFDTNEEQMVADYVEITKLLDKVGDSAKHYGRREMIIMCLDCAADLVDKERFPAALPFAEKAIMIIGNGKTTFEMNMAVEAFNIIGQVKKESNDYNVAIVNFENVVSLCKKLGRDLDDRMEFAFAYINLGDIYEENKVMEKMIENHENAIRILEAMNDDRELDDTKILVDLHQGLAAVLMDSGEVEKAEKHLMAAMKLGLPNMKHAMDNLGMTDNH